MTRCHPFGDIHARGHGAYGRGVGTLTEAAAEGIRGWRARRRMTQAELGVPLGLAARTVGDIELARRPLVLDELPVICDALGVTLAQLLDGADEADLRKLGLR